MKVNVKHPLVLLGLLLILVELFAFLLMPEFPRDTDWENLKVPEDLSYIPHMLVAITCSFIGFFTALFSMIIFILKGRLIQRLDVIVFHFVAFVLPVLLYQLVS